MKPIIKRTETDYIDPQTDNILIDVNVYKSKLIENAYGVVLSKRFINPELAQKEVVVNNDKDFPNDYDEDVEELRKSELSPGMLKRIKAVTRHNIGSEHISKWTTEVATDLNDMLKSLIKGMKYVVPVEPKESTYKSGISD